MAQFEITLGGKFTIIALVERPPLGGTMGIGVGLVLIAVGAILAFAVDVSKSHGFNVNTIGWILMIVGAVGVLLDLLLFMPRRRVSRTVDDGTVVHEREVL